VRELEVVDALRPPGALIEVRAVEAQSLRERSRQAEFVRLFLHVTVFAAEIERARSAFDELRLALETEARAGRRLESVSAERIARVFAGLDWNPPGRSDLVSFSAAIRLEVAPGREPTAGSALPASDGGPLPATTAEQYVAGVAGRHALSVQAVPTRLRSSESVRDVSCLLRPSAPADHHTLAQIGAFLGDIEAGSPGARVTRLTIERSSTVADNLRDDSWTFEAELTLRGPAP